MKIYIWATGLAFGLAGLLLGVGCSQPDLGEQAGTDVRAEATQTAEATPDVAVAMAPSRELPVAVPSQDGSKVVQAGTDRPGPTVRHAGNQERAAYDRARSRARDASRAARDARDARDAYGRGDR